MSASGREQSCTCGEFDCEACIENAEVLACVNCGAPGPPGPDLLLRSLLRRALPRREVMTEPDPIDYPATQFQDAGDEYVAWTPPPAAVDAIDDGE